MLIRIIAFVVLLLLAVWQFWQGANTFRQVRTSGNAGTSPFIAYGIWYGMFFGVILVLGAFMALFY